MITKRNIILLLIAVVYIITALNSNGYHHPDEHYQIIEFAGLKGGWNTGADLCWEYDAQIRPALQPMIALLVFNALNVFGISNPFSQATALRIISCFFALFCIGLFIRNIKPQIKEKYLTTFIALSCLLWFLPAINVRFSSETWAGFLLLLAVALLVKQTEFRRKNIAYFGMGALWALCFEFRYQMAIPLLGLFLWLIFIKKEKKTNLLYLFSGGVLLVAVCSALDFWYYGNWVFAPWNYFKSNLIDGVASNFGVSPWYYYLESILSRPTPLIGLLIALAFIVFFVYQPKNLVVWCIVPFLLVHSLIAHKELRFLFPIANFIPFILIMAYQSVLPEWKTKTFKAMMLPVCIVALVVNMGGLAMLMFKPASDGNIEMLRYLDRNYQQVNLYTIAWSDPYTLGNIKGLTPRFYSNKKVCIKNLQNVLKRNSNERLQDGDLVMLLACYHEGDYLEKQGFQVEYRSVPTWVEKIDRFYQVYSKYSYIFVLYSKKQER